MTPLAAKTPTPTPARIEQVAARAGVSTATVSRVLAGLAGPRSKAIQRVLEAAQALHYEPNRVAQALRIRRHKLVAVLCDHLYHTGAVEFVDGLSTVLHAQGYGLLLGLGQGNPASEEKLLDQWRAEGVAGMVLWRASDHVNVCMNRAPWAVGTVAIEPAHPSPRSDVVLCNRRESTAEALRHLLRLGHRRIGLIIPTNADAGGAEYLAGYFEGLRASGGHEMEDDIVTGECSEAGGQQAMRTLLDQPDPPRALLVSDGRMTLGVLRESGERGWRVPEDLALVALEDGPWLAGWRPAITAIACPWREMGSKAAQLLLERFGDPERPVQRVVLACRLVIRASCGSGTSPAPAAPGLDLDIATAD